MFERKTVFVIGAGCSAEYGLPVGNGLRDHIIARLSNLATAWRFDSIEPDAPILHALERLQLYPMHEWMQSAEMMARGLHHASSIDRYLHLHREDERIVTLGKLMIVRCILQSEAQSTLFTTQRELRHDAINAQSKGSHWLGQLMLLLQEGVESPSRMADMLENVTFVCFNYDRCIEHFFFHAVRDLGGLPEGEVSSMLSKLKVYHPYGRVGALYWQAPSEDEHRVDFGQCDCGPDALLRLTSGIKTFMERQDDDDRVVGTIGEAMSIARQWAFMGFSFLEQNMELIRPLMEPNVSEVHATTFGEPLPSIEIYERYLKELAEIDDGRGVEIRTTSRKAGSFIGEWGKHLKQ